MAIWNHGNHGTLFLFNTHECQETQTKNPFDPILSFGLIKDFWKWKKKSLKKDIFTKDFQRAHNRNKLMIKEWDDNNLLDTLKKRFTFSKMWNSKTLKIQRTIENLEFQNFKSALPHINGV